MKEHVRVFILLSFISSSDNLLLMDEASFWLVLILIHTVLLSLFVASSGLQVFQKEAHPSVYKAGGGGVKEGLSLFGINCIINISLSLFIYRHC